MLWLQVVPLPQVAKKEQFTLATLHAWSHSNNQQSFNFQQ